MVEESGGRAEVCVILDRALSAGQQGIVRVFANSNFSATRKYKELKTGAMYNNTVEPVYNGHPRAHKKWLF